jgi:carboxyl-terminal processing protease
VAALCYLVSLAVVNLRGTAASPVVNFVFPRIAAGNALDDQAVDAEWGLIQGNYVFRDVNGRVGTQGSEQGMVEALDQQFSDRFTAYLTSAEYAQLRATLSGQRGGSIGIALEARCAAAAVCPVGATPTEMVIEDVLAGQPAARAGIRPGDVLAAVGSRPLSLRGGADRALTEASALVRGPAGSSVRLTVVRGRQRLTFTVRRANLHLPSVFSTRLGSVLYLEVTGFDNGTGDDARRALRSGLDAGAKAVVLDLRQNGGGFVSEAQELASQFLKPRAGEQDVVIRRGRLSPGGKPSTAQSVVHDKILSGGVALSVPLVVLVDAQTASAAEIVTAALRDYHRATIVGERTFGKGSVQLDFPLPDGSDLHLTVERWYGPDGESIDGAGITPARAVSLMSPDQRFQLNAISAPAAVDAQLQAALAILHK